MEEITESPAVDSKEIKIQTIHPRANNLIFIISFLSYFILFHHIGRGNFGISSSTITIILLIAAVIASYFTSKFFSLNNTTVSIEQDSIEISSESNFLNTCKKTFIPLQDIKGYEFYNNNFYNQLILYRIIDSPFILTVPSKHVSKTKKFFKQYLPLINNKNRLSDQSFIGAFSRTALLLITTLITQALTVIVFELYSLEKYKHPLVLNGVVIFKFLIINLFVLFIFSRLFDRNNLRIKGKVTGYIFIIANFIMLNAISASVIKANYQLKQLKRPEEIFDYRTDKTFIISSGMQVDTTIVGYHSEITSEGRRSAYNKFKQYFVSPVNSFQKDWYRLWIGQNYEHRIKKFASVASSERTRAQFKDNDEREFLTSFKPSPQFYEVAYSDFNQSFNQKGFFSSAISSYKSVIPLIVLKPHFETYEVYKKNIKKDIVIFVLAILASIAISSSIAAYYR